MNLSNLKITKLIKIFSVCFNTLLSTWRECINGLFQRSKMKWIHEAFNAFSHLIPQWIFFMQMHEKMIICWEDIWRIERVKNRPLFDDFLKVYLTLSCNSSTPCLLTNADCLMQNFWFIMEIFWRYLSEFIVSSYLVIE